MAHSLTSRNYWLLFPRTSLEVVILPTRSLFGMACWFASEFVKNLVNLL